MLVLIVLFLVSCVHSSRHPQQSDVSPGGCEARDISSLSQRDLTELLQPSYVRAAIRIGEQQFEAAALDLGDALACLAMIAPWTPRRDDVRDFGFRMAIADTAPPNPVGLASVVSSLSALAMGYRQLGDYANALTALEQAAALRDAYLPGDTDIALITRSRLALVVLDQGEPARALDVLSPYIDSEMHATASPWIGAELHDIAGFINGRLGRWEQARYHHNSALQILSEAPRTLLPSVAEYTNNLGLVEHYLSRPAEAHRLISRSRNSRLMLYEGNHPAVAESHYNLSVVLAKSGALDDAISLLKQAIKVRLAILPPDHPHVVDSFNNLGVMVAASGDQERALDALNQACDIAIANLAHDHPAIARCYHNLGFQYQERGMYGQARTLQRKALDMRRRLYGELHPEIANSLDNLGILLGMLGDPEAQLKNFEQAYDVRRSIFETPHDDIALSLNNLGYGHLMLGDLELALAHYADALEMRRAIHDHAHPDVVASLNNIANLHIRLGNPADALRYTNRALAAIEGQPSIEPRLIALTLGSLADIRQANDQAAVAQSLYLRALGFNGGDDHQLQIYLEHAMAKSLRGDRNNNAAILYLKQAVNRIHAAQNDLSPERQATYLGAKAEYFRLLVEWLLEDERVDEAMQVMNLLDVYQNDQYLRGGSRTHAVTFNDDEAALSSRLAELARSIARKFQRKRNSDRVAEKFLNDTETGVLADAFSAQEKQKWLGGEAGVDVGRPQRLAVCQADASTAAFASRDVSAHLQSDDSIVLRYLVRVEKLLVVIQTHSHASWCRIDVDHRELAGKVRAFRNALLSARPQSDGTALTHNQALYDLLIRPLEDQLARNRPDVVILDLDATLRYLPFAALHDGERYLAERYALTYTTERLRQHHVLADQAYMAGFGLSESHPLLANRPLPWVKVELHDAVIENPGDNGVFEGEVHLNDSFTKARLYDALARDVPILHITGHFKLEPGDVADSFFYIGNSRRLKVRDLVMPRSGERLPLASVSLLALPSCETALGAEDLSLTGKSHLAGDRAAEVEGLAAGAMRAGAASVLASLWRVNDASMAAFMKRIYRHLKDGKSKALALSAAQREFIYGHVNCRNEIADVRQRYPSDRLIDGNSGNWCASEWNQPFHWAALSLYGAF